MHSSRMRTVRCRGRLPRGFLPVGCTPPPCGQTDTCKNITFPQQLLRTVKIPVNPPKLIYFNNAKSVISTWTRHEYIVFCTVNKQYIVPH